MADDKDKDAPDWGERADSVRKLVKGSNSVWVDKGSEAEASYLKAGWKGDDGSKKPSDAPEPLQPAADGSAFAAELAAAPVPAPPLEPTVERPGQEPLVVSEPGDGPDERHPNRKPGRKPGRKPRAAKK